MRCYWETIAERVPAEAIVAALASAGFQNVIHVTFAGLFSEYRAARP